MATENLPAKLREYADYRATPDDLSRCLWAAADAIEAAHASIDNLAAQVVEAEKYNGWHQIACRERDRVWEALKMAQRYLENIADGRAVQPRLHARTGVNEIRDALTQEPDRPRGLKD